MDTRGQEKNDLQKFKEKESFINLKTHLHKIALEDSNKPILQLIARLEAAETYADAIQCCKEVPEQKSANQYTEKLSAFAASFSYFKQSPLVRSYSQIVIDELMQDAGNKYSTVIKEAKSSDKSAKKG